MKFGLSFALVLGAYTPANHFVDATGAPLPQFEILWTRLEPFYQDGLPSQIQVAVQGGAAAEFEPPARIFLTSTDVRAHEDVAVMHETAHLGNYKLSGGATNTIPYRFLDEGLATIWQYKGSEAESEWRELLLATAKACATQGKVSFALVQDWSHYWGNDPATAYYAAYRVGASFAYFLEDRFGDDRFRQFLASLGQAPNLAGALQYTYGLTLADAEAQWLAFLSSVTDASVCVLP